MDITIAHHGPFCSLEDNDIGYGTVAIEWVDGRKLEVKGTGASFVTAYDVVSLIKANSIVALK